MDLPNKKFPIIYADPAWSFMTYSNKGKGRSPEQHYPCMTKDELKALPVGDIAEKNSLLWMWTIDTHIPQAIELMEHWGFEFKTVGFYWAKLNKSAPEHDWKERDFFKGLGYYTRANPEQCLIGSRGKGVTRKAMDIPRLLISKRREHSRKPDEAYKRIMRLYDGPYLEMFARQSYPGWDVWGNETQKYEVVRGK